jgi:hypothetical protein
VDISRTRVSLFSKIKKKYFAPDLEELRMAKVAIDDLGASSFKKVFPNLKVLDLTAASVSSNCVTQEVENFHALITLSS